MSFVSRSPAFIKGYLRRFWQESHDHRGTPGNPGLVACLLDASQPDGANVYGTVVDGFIYELADETVSDTLLTLDIREKHGYTRTVTTAYNSSGVIGDAFVYVVSADNPSFKPCDDISTMARQIAHARGPSGTNTEYMFRLKACLDEIGCHDDYIDELHRQVLVCIGSEPLETPDV